MASTLAGWIVKNSWCAKKATLEGRRSSGFFREEKMRKKAENPEKGGKKSTSFRVGDPVEQGVLVLVAVLEGGKIYPKKIAKMRKCKGRVFDIFGCGEKIFDWARFVFG